MSYYEIKPANGTKRKRYRQGKWMLEEHSGKVLRSWDRKPSEQAIIDIVSQKRYRVNDNLVYGDTVVATLYEFDHQQSDYVSRIGAQETYYYYNAYVDVIIKRTPEEQERYDIRELRKQQRAEKRRINRAKQNLDYWMEE